MNLSWNLRRSWLGMVLGTIFSLNQHLLNVSAAQTSRTNASRAFKDSQLEDNTVFIPTFELVMGTITYLVRLLF